MSRRKICFAAGCDFVQTITAGVQQEERTRLRAFPKDPSTCVAWVQAAGNHSLTHLTISKLCNNGHYYLCNDHFDIKDGSGRRFLNQGAIPKHFKHGSPLSNDTMITFLQVNRLDQSYFQTPHLTDLPNPTIASWTSQSKKFACRGLDATTVINVRDQVGEDVEVVASEQNHLQTPYPPSGEPMEQEGSSDGLSDPTLTCSLLSGSVQCGSVGSAPESSSSESNSLISLNSPALKSRQSSDIYLELNYACVRACESTNDESLRDITGNANLNDPISLHESEIQDCGDLEPNGSSSEISNSYRIQSFFSSFTPNDDTDDPSLLTTVSFSSDGVESSPRCKSSNNIFLHENISACNASFNHTGSDVNSNQLCLSSSVKTPTQSRITPDTMSYGTPCRPKADFTFQGTPSRPPGFVPNGTPSRPKPAVRRFSLGRSGSESLATTTLNIRKKSRVSLRSEFGISQCDQTPRKKAIWLAYRKKSSKLRLSVRKKHLLRKRLMDSRSRQLNVGNVLEFLKDKLQPGTRILVENELKNLGKPAKCKRYSNDMKCLALAMQRKGPKAFRLARKVMGFPSARSLTRLASSVEFEPGLCDSLFKQLKHIVDKMDPKNRVCSVIFDEMSIRSGVYFNESKDKVDGFVNVSDGHESSDQADHALVFMVQGLREKWKQPCAFYFTKGQVSAEDLVRILRDELIPALQNIGLIVKCTICDRGTTNAKAIKMLIKDAPQGEQYFVVNGVKIFTLFDYPHLLKCTRNHFLDKLFVFPDGSFADIEHIREIVNSDSSQGTFRSATKLTGLHVNSDNQLNNRCKMRVKYAAQLFSKSVEAVVRLIAEERRIAGLQPAGHLHTAQFVGFMDKLFDSVNGYTVFPQRGKPLFCVLKHDSGHLEFWEEAITNINSWKLYSKKSNSCTGRASVQDAWIHSLKATRSLWKDLNENYGFEYLSLRRLNQDAIENFFAQIRLGGQWNNNPTVNQFISAVKTALVDLLTNMNVRGSNCQIDDLTFLASLNALLGSELKAPNENDDDFVDTVDYSELVSPTTSSSNNSG